MFRVDRLKAVLVDSQSAREAPEDEFEGYLSVIILDLNMTSLRQQNLLMCSEWYVSYRINAQVIEC